jgi:urea transport system permease protein
MLDAKLGVRGYSADAMAMQQRKIGLLMLGLGAFFLLAGVPLLYKLGVMDITQVNNLGRYLSLAIVAIGADLVWGYTGILSLCQSMFFCFGGYAIGMNMAFHGPLDGDGIPRCLFVVSSSVEGLQLPWFWYPFKSLPLALILALFIPGVVAFLFGYFTFRSRVRGVYFSIITQAITLAMVNIMIQNNMKLCGTNGLTNFETVAGFDVRTPNVKLGLYMITVVVTGLVYFACDYLVRSRVGRLLVAVRDGESRLRFAGYQPVTFKLFIFVVSAMLGGIGGILYTTQSTIITPSQLDALPSIMIVACVAVGGRGTLSGAVIGTLIVFYLQNLLTSGAIYNLLPDSWQIKPGETNSPGLGGTLKSILQALLGTGAWYYSLGAIFILVTLFFPGGVVGAWRKLVAWFLSRKKSSDDSPAQDGGASVMQSAGAEKASVAT